MYQGNFEVGVLVAQVMVESIVPGGVLEGSVEDDVFAGLEGSRGEDFHNVSCLASGQVVDTVGALFDVGGKLGQLAANFVRVDRHVRQQRQLAVPDQFQESVALSGTGRTHCVNQPGLRRGRANVRVLHRRQQILDNGILQPLTFLSVVTVVGIIQCLSNMSVGTVKIQVIEAAKVIGRGLKDGKPGADRLPPNGRLSLEAHDGRWWMPVNRVVGPLVVVRTC